MIANAVQRGSSVYLYDETGQDLPVSIFTRGGRLVGFTASTVSIQNGTLIYTYDDPLNPTTPTDINGDSQITGGQRIVTFKLTADYNVSKSLNLRFYWDQMMSEYKISTAFPISQIRAGFSATFTFGN